MNSALPAPLDWQQLDWAALDRLREKFLSGAAARGPYWERPGDLAAYDATYAERIGWKWDAVLAELRARRWQPAGPGPWHVLDWGCGSGVAGRRVVRFLGTQNVAALRLADRSPLAVEFATRRAEETFPALAVSAWRDAGSPPVDVLVVSHVLNELDAAGLAALRATIARAAAVLWVEPGTHATARALQALRDELRKDFSVVAPCPHAGPCGLLAPGNERHWCHHFAAPPSEIFANSDWVKFGQRAGIDLRSLPYAFLALDRAPLAAPPPPDAARLIGRPELFKGFARVLSCAAGGVEELELQKRADPALFKRLGRDVEHPLYRWQRDGRRITGVLPAVENVSGA